MSIDLVNDLIAEDEQMKNADMPIHGEFKKAGDAAIQQGGLTKREYFAAMALCGFCADPNMPESAAKMAVNAADALLAALED